MTVNISIKNITGPHKKISNQVDQLRDSGERGALLKPYVA